MSVSLESLGLSPEAAASLPESLRRQVVRFLLRWGAAGEAAALLPQRDGTPRDRFDRCRVLLAAGQTDAARDLARELVNAPEGKHWGQRAVGEVFLALGKGDRADERFRAGSDPVGRARAWLQLQRPDAALEHLRSAPPEDPEAERVRLEALRLCGNRTDEVERHLEALLQEEVRELQENLGLAGAGGVLTEDLRGAATPEALTAALERVYGYPGFRGGQLDAILPLMEGRSVLGVMPTGAGKSLCFQLPAALLPGATVVISPLIALMKDQVDGLPPALYRRATLVNSSLEPGEVDRRLDAVARGEVSLVYAAPERLRNPGFIRALQRRGVSLFVVDEAHCLSLWGHDFRPDYFFIRQALEDLGRPTVLALTATATREMQADIGRQLGVDFHPVNLGTFRPNLQFAVRRVTGDADKTQAILQLLRDEAGPAIIYVDRRKLAEDVAHRLRQEGIAAEAYHAGMDREAREVTQDRFMRGDVRVIAATVAFGMGVDKADVRLVVHYNLPRSLEAYYQEAGRAGRDGLPARCVLLYTSYDKGNLTRRTNSDRLQAAEVMELYRVLVRRLRSGTIALSPEELERETAGDGTRIRVAVSLLQDLGAVRRGYDIPASLWLAPGPAGPMGEDSRPERFRAFAAAVGLNGRAITVPAAKAAAALGVEVDALEAELLDWQEAGWVRFRPGGRGMNIQVTPGLKDLPKDVALLLKRIEDMDALRLGQLAAFLETRECRQGFVSRYFGTAEPVRCGICDNCCRLEEKPRERQSVRQEPASGYLASEDESALFERLRAWRRERAREEQVPAYAVFHDRVLYAIAQEKPRHLSDLAAISGVGRSKLENYGEEILALVQEGE